MQMPCDSVRQGDRRIAASAGAGYDLAMGTELIFEVTEAEEGGYCATALGCGITTQGETLEELRQMVREAVACYFDKPESAPRMIRLHFVRDEILVP
jgi:predicted RNase H-like HicB family nuclease